MIQFDQINKWLLDSVWKKFVCCFVLNLSWKRVFNVRSIDHKEILISSILHAPCQTYDVYGPRWPSYKLFNERLQTKPQGGSTPERFITCLCLVNNVSRDKIWMLNYSATKKRTLTERCSCISRKGRRLNISRGEWILVGITAIVTDCLARKAKTNPSTILGPTSQWVRIVGWRHLGFVKSPVGTTL